jgi:hypothetical protein
MKYGDDEYNEEANWPHPDPERETWVDIVAWAGLWLASLAISAGFIVLWFTAS